MSKPRIYKDEEYWWIEWDGAEIPYKTFASALKWLSYYLPLGSSRLESASKKLCGASHWAV